MTKNRFLLLTLVGSLLIVGMACNLSDLVSPTPGAATPLVLEETETPATLPAEATFTPEPVAPDPTVTPVPPNDGQIAFASAGNIWLYQVSSGSLTQITVDGIADSYEFEYQNPLISADGRHLAYTKNNISYIYTLADGTVTNLIHHGRFFEWTLVAGQFFATRGNFECPALENLADQDLIAFDVLRFSLDTLDSPALLGNIAGGLRFPQAISNDAMYGSFLNCACYSECGGYSVWRLSDGAVLEHGDDTLYPGEVDFSPNSLQLAVANQQMYGYIESPLYLANADFSGLTEIYFEAGTAPVSPKWSPTGDWLAFTSYVIDTSTYEASNSRVMLIHPDGSGLLTVEGGFAQFLDWSPDGSKLVYSVPAEGGTAFYMYDLASAAKTLLPISGYPRLDWGVMP